jgi:hypothetical protein
MTNFFATLCVSDQTQYFHVSIDFLIHRLKVGKLLSLFHFNFSLLLMGFSIKFTHGFCGILCHTQLSRKLLFLLFQNLHFLLTFLLNSLFSGHSLLWFLLILLLRLFSLLLCTTFLDVLHLSVHEMGIGFLHLLYLIK